MLRLKLSPSENGLGEKKYIGRFRRYQARNFVLTHYDSEPLLPLGHDPILPFIRGSSQVW